MKINLNTKYYQSKRNQQRQKTITTNEKFKEKSYSKLLYLKSTSLITAINIYDLNIPINR